MIRSSCHSLKFANVGKRESVAGVVRRYRDMVAKYINVLWDYKQSGSLIPSYICNLIKTDGFHDSMLRQCAAKQALGMVKAVRSKQRKRIYKLAELQRKGLNTKYLQRKIDKCKLTKPRADRVNLELDSRFVDVRQVGGCFEVFIQLENLGSKRKIRLPLKHSKVSRKWLSQGLLKASIRLTTTAVHLIYEVLDAPKRDQGIKVGADQGQVTCLTMSDGQVTTTDNHGHDLSSIINKLARRKKGSRGFGRAQDHRKNHINWSIKQLNLDNVKTFALEKLKNVRYKNFRSRRDSHWTYGLIKDALVRRSEAEGFSFIEQDAPYRSQRCSQCGWTHKSNRSKKLFKCVRCQFTTDSDLNAALNHETELFDLGQRAWYRQDLKHGFQWNRDGIIVGGQESIVPGVQENLPLA